MKQPTTLLALLLVAACASHPDSMHAHDPDDGSSGSAGEGTPVRAASADPCDAPELATCVEDDDVAVCTKAAIKYEYEMLESRQEGDGAAFECHRDTLASLLDHACGLGDAQACAQAKRSFGTEPPA